MGVFAFIKNAYRRAEPWLTKLEVSTFIADKTAWALSRLRLVFL